jgi:hypothetical protein
VLNDVGETVALNAKSEAMPVVAPVDPETLMVQTTAAPIRAGLVFKQDKRDAVVGLPYTVKFWRPLAMVAPPTETLISNDEVKNDGLVENVKEEPPFLVLKAEVRCEDVTEKSEAMPVVAPEAPDTLMTQTTGDPTREGAIFEHARLDCEEGAPWTANVKAPLVTSKLLSDLNTLTRNDDEVASGLTEKAKVKPPSEETNGEAPAVEVTKKSEARPVVAESASEMESLHDTGEPIRAGLAFEHDRREAVVGFP